MAFRCMQCNGSMVFDIETQQMKCEHCGAVCDPEDFRVRDTAALVGAEGEDELRCPRCLALLSEEDFADGTCPYCGSTLSMEEQEENSGEELSVFLCQNCGAELEATGDSLIGFCPYCGVQSMVKDESRRRSEIEQIIPFQITRERCGELYQEYAGKIRYLPRDVKSAEHIRKFTGIYMPYFTYDASFGEASLSGTKTVESNARYDVVNSYSIPVEIEGDYRRGAPFDASKYLDDEISQNAMPFDTAGEKAFNPAYLAGFYADASTVSPELYLPEAVDRAKKDVVGELGARILEEHGIQLNSCSSVETTVTEHHRVLFPLWFLTWKKEDRVAYAVINGVSGKVVSDLPLDLRAFWAGCGKIALVLFLLLELFVQPTPQLTSLISLFAAQCMAMGILLGTKTVYDKQMHVHDKGWNGGKGPDSDDSDPATPPPEKKKKTFLERHSVFFTTVGIVVLIFLLTILMYVADGSWWKLAGCAIPFFTLIVVVFAAKKVYSWQKHIKQRKGSISITILLLSAVINSVICYLSPASDLWYYMGDALCILGLVFSSFGMLSIYNVGTTRPMPKLFDRKEV